MVGVVVGRRWGAGVVVVIIIVILVQECIPPLVKTLLFHQRSKRKFLGAVKTTTSSRPSSLESPLHKVKSVHNPKYCFRGGIGSQNDHQVVGQVGGWRIRMVLCNGQSGIRLVVIVVVPHGQ